MRFPSDTLHAFTCDAAGLPLYREISSFFESPGAVIHFLLNQGIFKEPPFCQVCGNQLNFKCSIFKAKSTPLEFKHKDDIKSECYRWRCNKRSCDGRSKSYSMMNGSVFEGMRKLPHVVLLEWYQYMRGEQNKHMIHYVDTTKNTLTAHHRMVRLIAEEDLRASPKKIGGPGIEIQVDESKFGRKFKHHRGKRGDKENAVDIWVVGGIESKIREYEQKRRSFAVVCFNRNKKTLNVI